MEKGERRKEKGERRKEKGERRKEKGERRKEKGERRKKLRKMSLEAQGGAKQGEWRRGVPVSERSSSKKTGLPSARNPPQGFNKK